MLCLLCAYAVWDLASACPTGSVLYTFSIVLCGRVHSENLLAPLLLLYALMACVSCFAVMPSPVAQYFMMSLIRNMPCSYVRIPPGRVDGRQAHASSCSAICRGVQDACIASLCC